MTPVHDAVTLAGRHVAFLSWRDTRNPEGGGAERYLEKMTAGLVERGCQVTVFCAAHDAAPRDEVVEGVRYVRRGGKLSVYSHGMLALLTRRLGRPDVVVDVQNGLPFFTRLVTRRPVVVLVHHVHREQWPVVYPGLVGRVGWWIEHRLAPRLYRSCQYVAVSQATREELQTLGVDGTRIAVVHNGTDPTVPTGLGKTPHPSACVVGRLVPHKQVEHAIEAAVSLREEYPGLSVDVVGGGWWDAELHAFAEARGAGETVVFHGHLEDEAKNRIYERSWVLGLPSLKEGWGLVVGEAGMHGTPAVAYRAAGGTRESIADGRSGLLVDAQEDFVAALRRVLAEPVLRARLSAGALQMSHAFTWGHAQQSFALVMAAALHGHRLAGQDPEEIPTVPAQAGGPEAAPGSAVAPSVPAQASGPAHPAAVREADDDLENVG